MRILWFVAAAGLVLTAAEAGRVELPISQSVNRGGWIRYSVPVKLGSQTVEAMLDTGSVGLRILPGVLAASDMQASSHDDHYGYGSGVELRGVVAEGTLSLGPVAGSVHFQNVQTVGCTDLVPHCAAENRDPSQFGIGGDGVSGQGYKAIFGTNLTTAEIDHPLQEIGITSWIVILPRPGESGPGKLILDPSEEERAGFTMLSLPDRRAGYLPGCLMADAKPDEKACGRVVFDTGAPGLNLVTADPPAFFPWPRGTVVDLLVEDDAHQRAGIRFAANTAPSYAVRANRATKAPFTRINGATPFLSYAILFDAKARKIGLKAREP